jgi:hypothetical protein
MPLPVNQDLARLFAPLLSDFNDPPAFNYAKDPWYWPRRDGREAEDWGLSHATPRSVLHSLWGEPRLRPLEQPHMDSFPGSVTAVEGATMYISTRPSCGVFPMRSAEAARMFNCFRRVFHANEIAACALHVTDVLKHRWAGGDGAALDSLAPEHWRTSLNILRGEWHLLRPANVLVTATARNWLSRIAMGHPPASQFKPGPYLEVFNEHRDWIRELLGGAQTVWSVYYRRNAIARAQNWLDALGRAHAPLDL